MIVFLLIRDVLRFYNDSDTIALRMFGGIGWIRLELHEYLQYFYTIYKNILGNTAVKIGMN